jgi:hypothetical protein
MRHLEATDRRGFLLATAGAGSLLGSPSAWTALAPQGGQWDLAWVDQLTGDYRQLFDVTFLQADPLGTVVNFLKAFEDVLGQRSPAVTAIIGVTGALPLVASDELWARYALGERWRVRDPSRCSLPTNAGRFRATGADPAP